MVREAWSNEDDLGFEGTVFGIQSLLFHSIGVPVREGHRVIFSFSFSSYGISIKTSSLYLVRGAQYDRVTLRCLSAHRGMPGCFRCFWCYGSHCPHLGFLLLPNITIVEQSEIIL